MNWIFALPAFRLLLIAISLNPIASAITHSEVYASEPENPFHGIESSETHFGEPLLNQDVMVWPVVIVNYAATDRITTSLEISPRTTVPNGNIETLIVRTWASYKVSDTVTLQLGYAFTPSDPLGEMEIEHRVFQALVLERKIGATLVSMRTMLEQRYFPLIDEVSHRLRVRLQLSWNLDARELWTLTSSAEFFNTLSEPTSGPRRGWDQARLLIGVGYKVSSRMRVALNYIAVFRGLAGEPPYRLSHVVQASLIFNL